MDIAALPTLEDYATRTLREVGALPGERARVENVLLEERPPQAGALSYASYLNGSPIADGDDWCDRHNYFVTEEIELAVAEGSQPWTFRPENALNRLPLVDRRINLIRVEAAGWPCSLSSVDFGQVTTQIDALGSADSTKHRAAEDFLLRFLANWNAERDQRPLYATTELEVEDILADSSASLAERLRNRLGLGHYSPAPGTPAIRVFIMRYPVEEAYTVSPTNGAPAVPTLLDGRLNDFFFPSPLPGPNADPTPCLGHSLNLAEVASENDYHIGVELLHPRFDYRPEHFLATGYIANPFTMPVERARRFHLPWVRLYRDRDDFGSGIAELRP
ncbi:MAG: hypothetical protein WCF44_00815 [Candidatus Methylophosphatis roskildensis]